MTGTDDERSSVSASDGVETPLLKTNLLGGTVTMIALLATRSAVVQARRTLSLLAAAVSIVWAAPARAEGPSDYCQKVTARAESDAALLFAPTAHLQLFKFPIGSPADASGFQVGTGVQPRAAVSIGLVDIYKGFGVLDAARADCRRQQSASTLEEVVAQRADIGRLPALERKLAFLRDHVGAVEEIVRNAEERFAAHATTLSEVQDIRLHALSFERRIATTEHEIAVIQARGIAMPVEPLSELLKTYESRAIELEGSVAHVQNLQPWKLGVSGGVAATPAADVFGVAELSYNFGGLFRLGAERRALTARGKELTNARYEMRQQIETIRRELRASAAQSRREASVVQTELARMMRDRASLDGTEAPNKHTLVATMTLQMIDLEAEERFLVALAEGQSAVGAAK
jgi:hypothetical protein